MAKISVYKQNFFSFIWHALFLAFASIFIDVNTVLTSLILNIGGSSIHVGILTGISIGLPVMMQLIFAAFLSGQTRKKPYLILAIYLRVISLAGMGHALSISNSRTPGELLVLIFLWVSLFSISGAFASVSYTDLLGKIFIGSQREKFLVFKQFVTALGMLIAAIVVRYLVVILPYPDNYALIFFIASGLLLIATFGFLMIKEERVLKSQTQGLIEVLKAIPQLLRSDKNLINYIILINLMSLGLTIIPFYVAFANSLFGLDANRIGNFLLFQFTGMILSTFIWNWVARRFRFKGLAYCSAVFGSIIPIAAVVLARYGINAFQWVFFIAGFFISAQMIFIQGMILEITNNNNRAIYTGISGTLSIAAVLFPLVAGILVNIFGYIIIFVMVSPLIMFSLYILRNIKCHRS
jgi:MFS family permease